MNDETREVARLLPDPARHQLPEHHHQMLKERLMAQISEETSSPPAPVRRRHRRLVPALAGGFLAVILVLWLTSAFVLGVGKFWAGRTEAGDLLNRIALVAASSSDIPPLDQIRDEQFIYVQTYGGFGGWSSGGWEQPVPHQRQIWLSVDGSQPGLLREETHPDDIRLEASPGQYLNAPTFRYLSTLPTDPDLLLAKIYIETFGAGKSPQDEAFVTIGDLMRESIVPPDLAVALYQAAARIPGVTVIDDAVDALGRHGIAVAHAEDGIRHEWIFDGDTLQFLGEREVFTGEPIGAPIPEGGSAQTLHPEPGQVIGTTAIVTRAIVDHVGEVPR